jgi:putative restriction endonuclease
MRYWWVNQNQTHRYEIEGGYLWSPKRNANGARNPFYEYMREVSPGDIIFSFVDTKLFAIGIASSNCYESPKPVEFGGVGMNWDSIGWKVRVNFVEMQNKVRPKDHINVLRPLLPERYSPLQPATGNGNQALYLTEVRAALAETLIGLMGPQARDLKEAIHQAPSLSRPPSESADIEMWEHHIEKTIEDRPDLSLTERQALIVARRGQGLFKERVMKVEKACRVTKVDNPTHLRASHCKPWRDANNEERLDGENGLLLTPSIDHLFDRGFISFEDNGRLIVSPVAHAPSLHLMGVETERLVNVGTFSHGQRRFLDYHRNSVLLQASH